MQNGYISLIEYVSVIIWINKEIRYNARMEIRDISLIEDIWNLSWRAL